MRTRPLAALSLVVLLMSAGCAGLGPGDAEPTAEELQDRALERMASVDSYRFNATTTAETVEATFRSEVDGAVNRTTRRAVFGATTRVDAGEATNEQVLDMYVDDRTVYVSLAGQNRWRSIDAGELPATATFGGADPSWENDRVERQRALLENASVEAVGDETVDGRQTTVIETTPANGSTATALESTSTGGPLPAGAAIESVELTQWVTDEGYVLRSETRAVVTVQGQTVNVTTRTEFDDLGEPVRPERPEGIDDDPA